MGKKTVIFLDGRMVHVDQKQLEQLAPGVVHGKGAFETMLAIHGKIFLLEEHLQRLSRGLKLFGIKMPFSKNLIKASMARLIRSNRLNCANIRVAVWREKRRVRTSIICRPFRKLSTGQCQKGFRAALSKRRRNKSRTSHVKSMDYRLFRQALEEARRSGYDEAILLNSRGEVVEGTRTNIFFVKNNKLLTPAIRCGCLNGITRRAVMRRARILNVKCRSVQAPVRQLQSADEAFLTNSLLGIIPLTAVEGRKIGRGRPGPLTRRLLEDYQTVVKDLSDNI